MRQLQVAFFLLVFLTAAVAAGSKPIVLDSSGQLEPTRLSEFVSSVEPHIREYPPQFESRRHKKSVTASMKQVVKEMSTFDFTSETDVALLTDVAHTLAMGHNLDLGTAERAKATFERAIALAPDDRRANYLCGMFLVSTHAYQEESIPYLQKAAELGEDAAKYTLGMVFVIRGEIDKGLPLLETYLDANPEDARARLLIQAAKDGTFQVRKPGGG